MLTFRNYRSIQVYMLLGLLRKEGSLEYTVLSEMSIITEYLECVFIEVNTRTMTQNKKIIVGIAYWPPSTNITTFIEHVMNIIDYLKVENKQCYIMGDFNINLTIHGRHTETQDYTDAMFQHSFIPLINKPTRITTTTATVIYCNDILGTNYQSCRIIYTDISDHLPIFLLTKQFKDTKVDTVIETRIYNEQATTTFKESIDQITWDEIYASTNPQESYSKFLNEI